VIAAEERALPVSFLTAGVCLSSDAQISGNSHPGYRLSIAVLYQGFEPVISSTATGFGALGYDFRVGPFYTGKARDAETGLDYFGARYMSSAQGRFTSPDPIQIMKEKLADPQQWNMYAYVRNNPLSNVDPDGQACTPLYMNSGSGFCARATEYGKIDAISSVQSQTRFFAAANAVSQALADVATPISGLFVSGQTASFLEGVGQKLETLNQRESSEIQAGSLGGPNLDQRLVHNEQSAVQDQLNGLKQSNPKAYTKTIGEINGSLNGIATKGLQQLSGTDRAYAGVLAEVRKDLGRNIDFSRQSDREAIGNALIKHIRQTGGCDVNGDKQPGCK
jgi:RHS repeat-associated protein